MREELDDVVELRGKFELEVEFEFEAKFELEFKFESGRLEDLRTTPKAAMSFPTTLALISSFSCRARGPERRSKRRSCSVVGRQRHGVEHWPGRLHTTCASSGMTAGRADLIRIPKPHHLGWLSVRKPSWMS